ncbi:MAG: ABC transporter permease [Acidimicrobiales bacterium]
MTREAHALRARHGGDELNGDIVFLWLLTARNLKRSRRTPMLIVFALLQPLIWLVMFSQSFKQIADDPRFQALGYHSYLSFFVPSMMALSVLYTALQSGLAVVTDIDTGMLDKLSICPIRRSSIVVGRILADAVQMASQAAVVLIVGVAMGATVATGWGGAFEVLGLTLLLGMVWSAVSNFLALHTRNSELTMVAGLFLTFPALFLSSAFFPMRLQPAWLRGIAKGNPVAYVVETGQHLMNIGSDGSLMLQTLAFLAAVGLTFTVAAVRQSRRSPL